MTPAGAGLHWHSLASSWQRRRRDFDARPRRERLLLIGALCGLAFLLADQLWLSPALKTWHGTRTQQRQSQLAWNSLLSEQAKAQVTGQAQETQLRADVAHWRARVRDGDVALREHAATLVGPDGMLRLLEQMLARQGQVKVRAMQSLGKTELAAELPATAAARAASGAAPPVAALAAGPALFRHGVELTLEGSYVDLLAYVRALEAMPQRLLWGGMQFRVEHYPRAVLTLKLYTLSLERHWLEI